MSQVTQIILLAAIFFSKKNHEKYHTRTPSFDLKLFWECLCVGGPSTIGHLIEISAWAFLMRFMAKTGEVYITVLAIGQALHQLFSFAVIGIQKATTAMAANYIGAKNYLLLKKLRQSSFIFLAIIMAVLFIPVAYYPDPIVRLFLIDEFGAQSDIYLYTTLTGFWV